MAQEDIARIIANLRKRFPKAFQSGRLDDPQLPQIIKLLHRRFSAVFNQQETIGAEQVRDVLVRLHALFPHAFSGDRVDWTAITHGLYEANTLKQRIDGIAAELGKRFAELPPVEKMNPRQAWEVLDALDQLLPGMLILKHQLSVDFPREFLEFVLRNNSHVVTEDKVNWRLLIVHLLGLRGEFGRAASVSHREAIAALARHFPNGFSDATVDDKKLRVFINELKKALPHAFSGDRLIADDLVQEALDDMRLKYPKAFVGGTINWLAIIAEVYVVHERRRRLVPFFPHLVFNGEIDFAAIERELRMQSDAGKSGKTWLADWEAIRHLAYHLQGLHTENTLRDGTQKQWSQTRGEGDRALVLMTGVILGLLFTAVFMGALDPPILWLTLVPIVAFSFTILNIIFVTFPLIGHLLISNNPHSREGMKGMLRYLVLIGMWRIWWKWRIERLPDDDPDYVDLVPVTVTRNAQGKYERTVVHRDVSGRFFRLTRVWFLLGILSSIGLVVTYIATS